MFVHFSKAASDVSSPDIHMLNPIKYVPLATDVRLKTFNTAADAQKYAHSLSDAAANRCPDYFGHDEDIREYQNLEPVPITQKFTIDE